METDLPLIGHPRWYDGTTVLFQIETGGHRPLQEGCGFMESPEAFAKIAQPDDSPRIRQHGVEGCHVSEVKHGICLKSMAREQESFSFRKSSRTLLGFNIAWHSSFTVNIPLWQ